MPTSQPATPRSEGTAGPVSRSPKYLQLGLVSVILALVVVIVVIVAMPPDEADEAGGDQQGPATAEVADPPIPAATIQLATQPLEITNEQLQNELLGEINQLVTRFPELPQALHVAAGAYDTVHQTAEAERLWRKCLELDARYPGPRLGLANLMSQNGKDRQAIDLLEEALDNGFTTAELYYRLASAHSKVGEVERAEEVMRAGVSVYPDVAINWLLLGQTQNLLQKYAQAEASLQRAVDLGCADPDVYFALGNSCRLQGKTEQAAAYLQKSMELRKPAADTQDRQFQEIYQQALRPVVVGTFSSSAAIYSTHGDPDQAQRLLLRANQLDPENIEVLEELVVLYRALDRGADALLAQQRLVELQPGSAAYRVNLANALSQLGQWNAAVTQLEEAHRLSPNSPIPSLGLAQALMQINEFSLARQHAEEALRSAPSAEGYLLLSLICQQLGDQEAATAAQQSAARLAPPGR